MVKNFFALSISLLTSTTAIGTAGISGLGGLCLLLRFEILGGRVLVIEVDTVHLAGGDVLKRLAELAVARSLLVLDDIPKHLTG